MHYRKGGQTWINEESKGKNVSVYREGCLEWKVHAGRFIILLVGIMDL